jgi:hypothetical protein
MWQCSSCWTLGSTFGAGAATGNGAGVAVGVGVGVGDGVGVGVAVGVGVPVDSTVGVCEGAGGDAPRVGSMAMPNRTKPRTSVAKTISFVSRRDFMSSSFREGHHGGVMAGQRV